MTNETSTIIAKELDLEKKELEREGLRAYLERELLKVKTELFSLAIKYNLKSIKLFEKAVKKGKIHETSETREDFFRWDYLERKIEALENSLKSL
ncbi:MAG: hypothetical protein COT33_02530 [Candidatus Nealsonbacteria bacterium CG08_land_8_20_14_0_20_38_20]|uniref:Uncharacterized protein n=1 Tax=Candidatus Nealsonbacteria bacterium CG08_land_8_20_14_0_20_38_20 TaxID=1974705 RepID=A0A2H0YM75_9BACT|nr:MAG: hypothetical protein COT33_02530 [Candidatus Nealsonbacteria bacterium CG08_land_8_20_14_0_20_38_20]